jgi:tetratricopeptide (TPR) repeat protein
MNMNPIPQRASKSRPSTNSLDPNTGSLIDRYQPDLVETLGDMHLQAGRIQEAIRCFSEVAAYYQKNGIILKCLDALRKLSKIDPTDPAIPVRIGDLLAEQGLVAEARVSYLGAGDSRYIAGESEAAIEAYQRVIDLDPTNAGLLSMLGGLYLECGLFKQAHQALTNARREYLKAGQIGLAREAAGKARSIEVGSGFHVLSKDFNKRKEARYPLRVRTCVVSENWKWHEYTESLNISRSGIRCSLNHPVERDSVLRLRLYVPPELGLYASDHSLYSADAMVCHSERAENGTYLIGAEFGLVSPIVAE